MSSVIPLQERRRILTEARRTPAAHEYVFLQGRHQSMPVVELPLELPLFRLNNGRLSVLKSEYLQSHETDPGFFDGNEESEQVQTVLHELLLELARHREASIYQELQDSALQTERLLLTGDGIVLDGNRRLASMRTLYAEDPETYSAFARVEAVLLPEELSETDLEMVEAAKQMAPDLKLAYSWIDRRFKLRHHRDNLEIPVEVICKNYRLESGEELDREIGELELAEEYLQDYLEQPGHYKAVDFAEAFFTGLFGQLSRFPEAYRKQTWKLVGFAMIKEAQSLNIDPNRQFPLSPPDPPFSPVPVLELYGGENNLWPYTSKLGSGAVLRNADYKTLARHLNRPGESQTIAQQFIHLFSHILSEHNDRPHPIAVVNRLKQVNTMLGKLELEAFTESQRSELFGQLAETAYQFRYLTQSEGKDSVQPVVVTGFPRVLKPVIRFMTRIWLGIRGRFRELWKR